MYQYFISIVPTVYKDVQDNVIITNQYAITEYRRAIDHDRGSHGIPGATIGSGQQRKSRDGTSC